MGVRVGAQVGHVAGAQLDVGDSGILQSRLGPGDHRRGTVDAVDLESRPGEREEEATGAAAEFEHGGSDVVRVAQIEVHIGVELAELQVVEGCDSRVRVVHAGDCTERPYGAANGRHTWENGRRDGRLRRYGEGEGAGGEWGRE